MTPEEPVWDVLFHLEQAKRLGLTFSDCIQAFAATEGDDKIYAEHARAQLQRDGQVEVDESTVVSASDTGAYVMAWLWVSASDIWTGPTDSDGAPCRFINHYVCAACEISWQDQWSATCNDRCPSCDAEIEPRSSDELDLAGNVIQPKVEPTLPDYPSFTCPKCGLVSYHPKDRENRFCAKCGFVDDPSQ